MGFVCKCVCFFIFVQVTEKTNRHRDQGRRHSIKTLKPDVFSWLLSIFCLLEVTSGGEMYGCWYRLLERFWWEGIALQHQLFAFS